MANEQVPESLKQLSRLIAQEFYTTVDLTIVDFLLQYPRMKENDICEILKLDNEILKSRIAVMKSAKLILFQWVTETGSDGKARNVNYHSINYRVSSRISFFGNFK